MKEFLGTHVCVTVDRPLGSSHPNYPDTKYLLNYGYINGVIAPDGEALDAYIMGVDIPVDSFEGEVIAIIHRINDIEDKLVVAKPTSSFSTDEIKSATNFIEKYFNTLIIR